MDKKRNWLRFNIDTECWVRLENQNLTWDLRGITLPAEKTLSGAGEVCFRGLYEVSLALVGVSSPA